MLKDVGYQEKVELLKPWLVEIVEAVKKDLKNEHLKVDRDFCRRYFLGKSASQVTVQEMADAYYLDVIGGNSGLGEFIATRWILKNTDIYGFFEQSLKPVSEDFDELDVLPEELALSLLKGAIEGYGARKTYLFAVLNSVVFPKELYEGLRAQALEETESEKEERRITAEAESRELMEKRHAREMAALTDRYEKKLGGLQRKYLRDTEALKKQISQLQKRLST